jgi:lysozyme
MNENLKPSPACRALVRQFEGCYLTAYKCPAGVWTLGSGHTRGVKPGDRCSVQQADVWLTEDLAEAAEALRDLVRVPLTQGQFDALVSFIFNLGVHALAESTLLIMLNKGQAAKAAGQFQLWTHAHVNGQSVVLPGLVKRRDAEAKLFLSDGVTS